MTAAEKGGAVERAEGVEVWGVPGEEEVAGGKLEEREWRRERVAL